jgi:hypothetical protein
MNAAEIRSYRVRTGTLAVAGDYREHLRKSPQVMT